MKTVAVIAAGAALAAAQGNSSLSSLPQCGQTCVTNLISIVQQAPYNCPDNPTCFCCQANFGFGIRDCADQSCPSSTDANSAIAYAVSYCASALPTTSVCTSFSSGSSATASGSSASATAAAPSGPAAFIQAINGGISGYSLASTTATAGGPEVTASGTEYSALPSDGGIVATASGLTTTIPPSGLTAAAASSGTGSAAGGAAGPAGFIVPVESGVSGYSVASTTITAGGPEATLSGTEYSALPSAGGVVATASGLTTTYAESQLGGAAGASGSGVSGAGQTSPASQSGSGSATGGAGGAGGSSGAATTTTMTTGGAGGSGSATSSSTQGSAAIVTVGPVLLGAAALAILAL